MPLLKMAPRNISSKHIIGFWCLLVVLSIAYISLKGGNRIVRTWYAEKLAKEITENIMPSKDNSSDDNEIVRQLYKSVKILKDEYGSHVNVDHLAHHLGILKTRVFPRKPRPLKCDKCNVYKFRRLISPRNICSGKGPIDLLIATTTVPSAEEERRAIRTTWASHTKNNTGRVRHLFLYGSGWNSTGQAIIKQEDETFGDLIQDDFKDAYYNLSYKVVMAYKWALKDCARAKYVLRTAHDNFINVPAVLRFLEQDKKDPNKKKQIGKYNSNFNIERKRAFKWYISRNEYMSDVLPVYDMGTAFIYSMEIIQDILHEGENVPYFSIEDAWFGMIMNNTNIKVMDIGGFNVGFGNYQRVSLRQGKCPFSKPCYTVHLVSPQNMRDIWKLCKKL